jgi:Ribonuclease G/E
MSLDLEHIPADARDEIIRLRALKASVEAYARLLEGALLTAWQASAGQRSALEGRSEAELNEDQRRQRAAWELVREIVLRVPVQS